MEVLKQGAEARLYKRQLFGIEVVMKERFKKLYRHSTLDEKLSQKRTFQEIKSIMKCRKAGIKTPLPFFVDTNTNMIAMEFIDGSSTLRDIVDALLKSNQPETKKKLSLIAIELGELISKLHAADIIHGDLTTSNVLVTMSNDKYEYTLIDFGLSYTSSFAEDMGVDLYVLERAFLSTHPNTEWLFAMTLQQYFQKFSDQKRSVEVREKLDEIRMRGRKRIAIG